MNFFNCSLKSLLLIVLALFGAYSFPVFCQEKASALEPTVLLVSIDGFRWDYFDKAETPNFDMLVGNGVKAESLIPPFPSETFPSHYTIATGLYPAHHGIVGNYFYDPQLDRVFSMRDRDALEDPMWWGGEPIWVTAEQQGQTAATLFWVGSEAPVKDVQPTYWKRYDGSLMHDERIDQVLQWLDLPADKRPTFLTCYFSLVDSVGHRFGPDSMNMEEAVATIDADLGDLIEGLRERGLFDEINMIIVSDHGMAKLYPQQVIYLDDYIDMDDIRFVHWNGLDLWPEAGKEVKVFQALTGAHPQLKMYRRNDIPERLHYRDGARVPPLLGLIEEGWTVSTRNSFHRVKEGGHGYDPRYGSMHGIFIAHGPAFEKGKQVDRKSVV